LESSPRCQFSGTAVCIPLYLLARDRIKIGNLQQIIIIEKFLRHAQVIGTQAGGRNAASFALPRLCICTDGSKMCLPPTGIEDANPVTPQPPSSSVL